MGLLNLLLRKVLSFPQRAARFTSIIIKEWSEKQEWRRYSCGIYTDLDEIKRCPACGLEEESEIVIIRKLRLRWLNRKRVIWTKYSPKVHLQ